MNYTTQRKYTSILTKVKKGPVEVANLEILRQAILDGYRVMELYYLNGTVEKFVTQMSYVDFDISKAESIDEQKENFNTDWLKSNLVRAFDVVDIEVEYVRQIFSLAHVMQYEEQNWAKYENYDLIVKVPDNFIDMDARLAHQTLGINRATMLTKIKSKQVRDVVDELRNKYLMVLVVISVVADMEDNLDNTPLIIVGTSVLAVMFAKWQITNIALQMGASLPH